jgi:hypothetical protein
MAIVFDTPFNDELIHYSGINNIIKYTSNSTGSPIAYSTISFNSNNVPIIKTLFPGPSNKFYYNFKEMIQILMNVNNHQDNIDYSQLVNNWSPQGYYQDSVIIKIYFENETYEQFILDTSWLSGYLQYWNFKPNYTILESKYNAFLLKPKLPFKRAQIKYWTSYPFSIGFYTGETYYDPVSLEITGGQPGGESIGEVPSATRLVISDGQEEFIALQNKMNYLRFNFISGNSFKLDIEKITEECLDSGKVYLKWLNSMGDFDYYLFDVPDKERSSKSLGSISNDFNNFLGTTSPEQQIGFETTDSFDIYGTYSPLDMVFISELFISPKTYLFTGTPGEPSTNLDWLEIKVKSSKIPLSNRKSNNVQFKFSIEMPDLNTRKL